MVRKKPIVHVLKQLKEGTKIVENAKRIIMDIPLPLDKEDYEFLKMMNEQNISIKGRFILGNKIIGFFDNGVKSVGSYTLNNPQLE